MSDLFKWQKGRQGTGYKKLLLARSNLFKFDLWLLKYEKGDRVPPHVDHIKGRRHVRVNLVLVQPIGGIFMCNWPIFMLSRLHIFRSDFLHSVSTCYGPRLVLSLGLSLKER